MKQPLLDVLRDACERATKGGELVTTTLPPLFLSAPKAEHGDLATDVAIMLARGERKPPRAVAETIVRHLDDRDRILADVSIAGPGFVNFRFAPSYWWACLCECEAAGERYGASTIGAGTRVHVELVRPDPAGPLHLGHVRAALTAEAVARLLAATGHVVDHECELSEAGEPTEVPSASREELCGRAVESSDVAYDRDESTLGFDRLIEVRSADQLRTSGASTARGRLEVMLVGAVSTRGGAPVGSERVTVGEVVEEIGVDAARFFLLMRKLDVRLDVDLDLARRRTAENPLFYVRYAYARVASLLRRAAASGLDRAEVSTADAARLDGREELALVRSIAQFPELVEHAALACEPYRVVGYLMELAGAFHRYYNRVRILEEDRELARARLLLAANVHKVIRVGLGMLGISAPDTM